MRTIYAFIIAAVMFAFGANESWSYDFRLRAVDILTRCRWDRLGFC